MSIWQFEAIAEGGNCVFFQQALQDLHNGEPMKNSTSQSLFQLLDVRHQRQPVADAVRSLGAQAHAVHDPVYAGLTVQAQEGRLAQQRVGTDRRLLANQVEVEAVRLIEGFPAVEPQDMQAHVALHDRQAEGTFHIVAHCRPYFHGEKCEGYETPAYDAVPESLFRKRPTACSENVDEAGTIFWSISWLWAYKLAPQRRPADVSARQTRE
jgi:hypothetical protein